MRWKFFEGFGATTGQDAEHIAETDPQGNYRAARGSSTMSARLSLIFDRDQRHIVRGESQRIRLASPDRLGPERRALCCSTETKYRPCHQRGQ